MIKKFYKIMITIIITLVLLILFKSNSSFKRSFYNKVYENTINFSKINSLYQTYFGNILPINNKNIKPVFNEKLVYEELEKYNDGVKLKVTDNYLVPSQSDGVVTFIGEKEGYGKVIIVNQTSGVDIWYGNLENINVSLYDYVNKGQYLGNVNNELYLVYKKNGKVLNYEEYI